MADTFNCDSKPLALVVDDDPVIRMVMTDMVEELGFEVIEAGNVSAALAVLGQSGDRFSLLLTDVQMPGSRDGATLANHVSFMWPHIRILVTSGVTRPADGALPHAAKFLSKPLSHAALQASVAAFPADMLPHP